MSNAAKHRKKAAEFEQLKQIDRAIAAYIKAIEESEAAGEEVDVALFNKVGDLALRQGRIPDAITYYERAVEHYATSGLFNNAIALCNKILRSAPGRANVYFTLGRICARKGLRGDATKNFLEYATRMREEERVDEGMRALAEIADLFPELTEVGKLVDEYARRAGLVLPRRLTPPVASVVVEVAPPSPAGRGAKSPDLVFIHVDYSQGEPPGPTRRPPTPVRSKTPVQAAVAVDTLAAALIEPGPGLRLLRDLASRQVAAPADEPVAPVAGLESADGTARLGPSPDATVPDEPTAGATPVDGSAPADDALPPPIGLQPTATVDADRAGDVEVEAPSEAGEDPDALTVLPRLPILLADEGEPVTDHEGWTEAVGTEEAPAIEDVGLERFELSGEEVVIEVGRDQSSPLTNALEPEGAAADAMADVEAGTPRTESLRITPLMLHFDLDTVDEQLPPTRPPFRIDPHDLILPGELPPLVLDDAIVEAGVRAGDEVPVPAAGESGATVSPDAPHAADGLLDLTADLETLPETSGTIGPELVAARPSAAPDVLGAFQGLETVEVVDAEPDAVEAVSPAGAAFGVAGLPSASDFDVAAEALDPARVAASEPPLLRSITPTPALPTAAVAAEATILATSRRDALRAAVRRLPNNWGLRRRLAEALLESGERDEALEELDAARQGFVSGGNLSAAAEIADEMVQVSPDRVAFHQLRVELAVAMHDLHRLRMAYLDLADALLRLGEEGRARAVYARVLEIDPLDGRARAALGPAAPPPPPPAPRPDDDFIDLAVWLREDEGTGGDTRLRMREPRMSGDEQADFDELLRHFKEGVSRSLGEDDFESHYDLGVAYKEMGLLDDAIAEFQKALRGHGNRLPAYEALGQCFVEQGRHQVAATVLTRALHEPGLGDGHRVGVLYLLAFSCEALQRFDEARSYYQRVYAIDIQFRDTAARLAALEHHAR